MDIETWVQDQLAALPARMARGGAEIDDLALGKLVFYASLRRVLGGQGSPQDVGLLDAVNDTLQALGIVESDTTFYRS